MAKKYVIYVNGKDLAQYPVTQNEVGVFYRNAAKKYYTPILANFDNAKLPSGYTRYVNGSHAKYKSNAIRNPIDFSILPELKVTANFDFNMRGKTLADGSWCKGEIVGTNAMLGFVHTYGWGSGIIKAGNTICKIAPKSITGFGSHLHMDEWTGKKIRDLILTGDFKMSDTLKIGDKVKIVDGYMNLRHGAGTGFTNGVKRVEQGAVVKIKDGIRTSQNKLFYGKGSTLNVNDTYQWIDIVDVDGQTGWMAITNKVQKVHGNTSLTRVDGTVPSPTPVEPPKPPVEEPTIEEQFNEYKKQAKAQIEELSNELVEVRETLEGTKKLLQEANGYRKYQKLYMDAVEALNKQKEGRFMWIVEFLEKVFPSREG